MLQCLRFRLGGGGSERISCQASQWCGNSAVALGHSTLEKNLNFLTRYSCRIDDCPLAFLTFIKFPEVQDRAYFPSQFPAHVLEII